METISNNINEATPLMQNAHDERSDNEVLDSDTSQNQYVDGADASDILDFDFPDQGYGEHQWRNGDTMVRLSDGIDYGNNKRDVVDASDQEILDDDNQKSTQEILDDNSPANRDDFGETNDNKIDVMLPNVLDLEDQIINSVVDTQQQENGSGNSRIGTNGEDISRESSYDGHGITTEQNLLDIHDEPEPHNGICSMDQEKQTGTKLNTAVDETTTEAGDSGTENDNNNGHHHYHHTESVTTEDGSNISINNKKQSSITKEDVTAHEIVANETVTFNVDTSLPNENLSREQRLQYILSASTIPYVSMNDDGILDNTTQHVCKLEQNDTGLGNNTSDAASSASELSDIKPPVLTATCQGVIAKEPPTPKMIYQAKVKKITESSLSDGLNMVRKDENCEFNRRERLWILFDIIFSISTTTTTTAIKTLDIDKALTILEELSLDSVEKDWLMGYCFNSENQLLKLLIMRYNIEHGKLGLVMMQNKTMKSRESDTANNASQQSQASYDENRTGRATYAIGRSCDNLAKLSRKMLPSVLQDLPLEIFGQPRGKVGNPFLNEEKPSLLQEKGLGLGSELLLEVMQSRKRRRLN
ncbi:unnamed protein product [Absidia cylindrospora]